MLTLFFTFLKIGAFAFGGGYAVLPLIETYVVRQHEWLSMQGLTDLVSLSQITPGPIAINSATFIGTKVAGLPGALVATLGNVLPQFMLMMILGYFIFQGKSLPFLKNILKGLRPTIVSLIAIATLSMLTASLYHSGQFQIQGINVLGVVGFAIGFFFYRKKTLSVIQLVLLSVAVGLVLHGLLVLAPSMG